MLGGPQTALPHWMHGHSLVKHHLLFSQYNLLTLFSDPIRQDTCIFSSRPNTPFYQRFLGGPLEFKQDHPGTMATDAKDATAAPEGKQRSWSGFDKTSDYFSSLKQTPKLFAKRCAYVRSPEEQLKDKEAASGDMKQVLNWFHVMALGT